MKIIKKFKWWLVGLVSVMTVLGIFFLPLPYYIEMPGGAYDIRAVLNVDGLEDKEEGSYNFVAVGVTRATPIQILAAWMTPYREISSAEETTGGVSDEDYWRISQFYMETSQNAAISEALTLAGEEVELSYLGVYVLNLSDNSTFKDVLNLADTVTGVNGKEFSSSKELIDYVGSQKLGDDVTVQYISDGDQRSASGKIIKLDNGRNGIGIGLTDHTEIVTNHSINFYTDGVGGPSAGMMFTLSIYDQLIEEDLRKGRMIAGTGTIEKGGAIGDIGGAGLKVVAADQEGAEIFFVPDNPIEKGMKKYYPKGNNYEEAKAVAKELGTDMKIVPVTNIKDAIDYLRKNP
ncbi:MULTISPECIES: SepM family pheromone-processing serine protease [Streptococcus]|uniref:SepM family pheromone-processing serine protease n=1 Tax=Streptococcus caledonicus TaxID=2614158 RepID=A0ABW0UJ16_9STRE|nr:SepM family pheromone-processing serine protease [Streptococcus sp. S784/96/1]